MKRFSRVFIFLVLLFSLSFTGCDPFFGVQLPEEIQGEWEYIWNMSSTVQYIETFTIGSDYIAYSGYSLSYSGYAYWDEDVVWVDKSAKMFKTADDMYFAWHLDGNTLYLHKTNPGADKPVLSDGWWTSVHYRLTRI